MRDPGRLVEAQVLARAAARGLVAGLLLGAGALPIVGAGFGLAAGATAIVERAAVIRALDAGRPLRRAALEASVASGLVAVLALLQLLVVAFGRAGPEGQVAGLSAMLGRLGSARASDLVDLILGLAAVGVSVGALSGALALDRMDQRTSESGGVWSRWLLDASLLLALLALAGGVIDGASLEPRRLGVALGYAALAAILSGVVLHLTMGAVYVLDRGADAVVRLAGVRPSVVEAQRTPASTEPPA